MNAHHRTALLIRCSDEEAHLIRHAAKQERRSISGYVSSMRFCSG